MEKQEILNSLEDIFETYQYLHTKSNLTWETISDGNAAQLNQFEVEKILDLMQSIKLKHAEIDSAVEKMHPHLSGQE